MPTLDDQLAALTEAARALALDWPHEPGKEKALAARAAEAAAAGADPSALAAAHGNGYTRGSREREERLAADAGPATEPAEIVLTAAERAHLTDILDRLNAQVERMQEPKRRTLRGIGSLESLLLELEAATDAIYGPDHYAYDNPLRHIEQFAEVASDRSAEMREQRADDWDSAVLETERWVIHNLRRDLDGLPHSDPMQARKLF